MKSSLFFCALVCAIIFTAVVHPLGAQEPGLDSPQAVGAYLNGNLPIEEPHVSGSWVTVPAFPDLTFDEDPAFPFEPIYLTQELRGERMFVLDKKGRLWSFLNRAGVATKKLVLDIEDSIKITPNAGAGTLAFHPDFGLAGSPSSGFLYMHYYWSPDAGQRGGLNQVPDSADELGNPGYWRLSRFTLPVGSETIDPASELVLMQQYDAHHWHNGGSIFFDQDGFLYLCSGDIGGDQNFYVAGQTLAKGFFGGVLRIDVDKDPSRSHPIRRQPTDHDVHGTKPAGWPDSYSQEYFIPDDNPWLEESGANLEEFWSLGIRSPHRMTYDPESGDIWVGDVGQFRVEEVYRVVKGGNYQWPYLDGTLGGYAAKPGTLIGTDQPPVFQYQHGPNGAAVIGGYVYRGYEHRADLTGKYIFSDHQSGKIYALTDASGTVEVEVLTSLPGAGFHTGISSFGTDVNGELYICRLNRDSRGRATTGALLKLSRTSSNVPEPPALLSQTGAFSDLATLEPTSGMVAYQPNSQFWSDGAVKTRYAVVPNDGAHDTPAEQVTFAADSNWQFPKGTVFVKHFDYPVDERDPTLLKRLETRFFVHGDDGRYYGFTYRWRDDESEADLLADGENREVSVTTVAGETRMDTWTYPSRAQCLACHTSASGSVLGLRTHQLNGDYFYAASGRTANQLRTWNHLGIFSGGPDSNGLDALPRAHALNDSSASLENRARSFLDTNCASCHQPGGVYANFDARFSTPLAEQNLLNGFLVSNYGIEGQGVVRPREIAKSILHRRLSATGSEQMPPLARNRVDTEGIRVVAEWINSLVPTEWENNTYSEDNGPPSAISDTITVVADQWTVLPLLANDSDADGNLNPASFEVIAEPKGMLTFDAASMTVRYRSTGVGEDTFLYEITDAAGLRSNSARVSIQALPEVEAWIQTYFGGTTPDWAGDPDGDGANHLLEFALGGNPTLSDSPFSALRTIPAESGSFWLEVTKGASQGLSFTLEFSPDLLNWSPADLAQVTVAQDDSAAIVFQISGIESGFFRVKVELQ